MTKLTYLAAMTLLGLGLTMAQQHASTPSDSSNSSTPSAVPQKGTTPNKATSTSGTDQNSPANNQRIPKSSVPDTTVRDQQRSTTSTTDASGQTDSRPSTSTMGTTGSTPGTEDAAPANNGSSDPQTGTSTDQQPNSSSSPATPAPHLVMNQTPGARAVATHTPDPGTCMSPAAMDAGQYPSSPIKPNCD
jgi:hypothetical protein